MILTLTEVMALIVGHWINDFILQDEEWAANKSKSWAALLIHTFVYSCGWLVMGLLYVIGSLIYQKESGILEPQTPFEPQQLLLFGLMTFLFHTATDYFTSKTVKKKFEAGDYGQPIPNFGAFTVIGFDQVLHYMQLFLTYLLIFK